MTTYIDLTNKLRDRFNEVRLVAATTWLSTVGFDQFSKDAINYAYMDIINAEIEWPFLHQSTTFKTTPGIQLYSPTFTATTGFVSPAELKNIDWDSFYIASNETITTYTDETHTVSATAPYSVTATHVANYDADIGAKNAVPTALTPVTGDPASGQYTVTNGIYYFNSNLANTVVKISYKAATQATQAVVINPQHLPYIDYDLWRQAYLSQDLSAIAPDFKMPANVFRTQNFGEIGLTPVPDKIYNVLLENWLTPLQLSATTDVPLIPNRFQQIIMDGAEMYVYKFREDMQLAAMAEKKFLGGIQRMRTELVNPDNTMKSGFYWYAHGRSYTLNTLR